MKFTNILKSIILENSRFKILYDKMVAPAPGREGDAKKPKGLMDFETLKAIILADPTTRVPQGKDIDTLSVEDMDNVKVGKYTQWLLKNFVAPTFDDVDERANIEKGTAEYKRVMNDYQNLFIEDLHKTTEDLKKYERFKNQFPQEQRDINKLTLASLFELTKDLSLEKAKASKSEKEEAKKTYEHPGANVVFRGNEWTVIKIEGTGELQRDAACFYGGNQMSEKGESRWCTSAPGLSYWKGYLSRGPLYVILPNESSELGQISGLPVERYQFHFQDEQFMDRHDRQQDLVQLLNGKLKELKDYFKPEFAKNLVKSNEDKLTITIPRSAAGKFVAIYGFEEIFDNIPDNLTLLHVENNGNESLSLDIPETISRFQNLENLMLSKIVRKIPDSISQLKNLEFLSLPDNPNLERLPESIANMEGLSFIGLAGSNPERNLPESVKEKFSDYGNGLYFRED